VRRSSYPLFLTLIASLLGSSISIAAPSVVNYGGRDLIVDVPAQLPSPGARALVVVLHGGMGNAGRIASGQSESGLNMDAVAEKDGFIVAYLNGTPATRLFGNMLAWNAGGCCGQPAENNIDDAGYIKDAVGYLIGIYGVDPARVYGIGHSNGAMMTERVMCETGLYAAAVAISGPLMLATASCPAARGKRILAIHGADDRNVPVAGGKGTKGISGAVFNSEAHAQQVFTNSGASYALQIVPGADHRLDDIDRILRQSDGISIPQKAARFFGLE
jgi:poly(3-hydroxybutyrate) depolymerase